jgi:hypothetical protein
MGFENIWGTGDWGLGIGDWGLGENQFKTELAFLLFFY